MKTHSHINTNNNKLNRLNFIIHYIHSKIQKRDKNLQLFIQGKPFINHQKLTNVKKKKQAAQTLHTVLPAQVVDVIQASWNAIHGLHSSSFREIII